MKRFRICIAAATIASFVSTPVLSQVAQILANMPIDKLTEQVGQGVAYVVDQLAQRNANAQANSVGQLVKDLATLSGLETSFADRLDLITSTSQQVPDQPAIDSLNELLVQIHQQFFIVDNDLRVIDPKWAQSNALLQGDLGNFAHDGALFYCIQSCSGRFYSGGPAIRITGIGAVSPLSMALRADVIKIRALLSALQGVGAPAPAN